MATTGAAWIPKLPPTANRPSSWPYQPRSHAAGRPHRLVRGLCRGHRARVRLRLAILAFGLVGIAGGYGYTSGFWPYKYHACGPIMVFLLMGPLMALPAYYIQGGSLDWRPFSPPCLLRASSPASCTANDIRDIAHDLRGGITTLAMLLGRRKALYLYAALCVGAYGVLLLLAAFGVLPLSGLLPFVLAPGLWRTGCGRSGPGLCPNPNSYRWTAYPRGTISCSGCCSLPEYCCRGALNWRRA